MCVCWGGGALCQDLNREVTPLKGLALDAAKSDALMKLEYQQCSFSSDADTPSTPRFTMLLNGVCTCWFAGEDNFDGEALDTIVLPNPSSQSKCNNASKCQGQPQSEVFTEVDGLSLARLQSMSTSKSAVGRKRKLELSN